MSSIIVKSLSERKTADNLGRSGFILVGGGAHVNWSGYGNLLTASYPSGNTWIAKAKDHSEGDPATLTAYAIGLKKSFIKRQGCKIQVKTVTSGEAAHPSMSCSLDHGYFLLNGGAHVNWKDYGNLLTASYPKDRHTWKAKSKDHSEDSWASISVYAIGISK